MKIEKYVKEKQNKYKVTIDGEDFSFYDDVIIKYELLRHTDIDADLLQEIILVNDELKSYYDSIKYITKRLRSEQEIYDYLNKKEIKPDIIKKTIQRLKDNNFINEDIYLRSYINDQINLSNNGPKKIKSNLLKLGLEEAKIDEFMNKVSYDIWHKKISNYIEKKIKSNHNSSEYMLKIKIINDLVNLGYNRDIVSSILANYDIIDLDIYEREKAKARRELSRKYSGYELEKRINMRMYRKGFRNSSEESNYEE